MVRSIFNVLPVVRRPPPGCIIIETRRSSDPLGLRDATSKVKGGVLDWPNSPKTESHARHAPTDVRPISISSQVTLLLEFKTAYVAKAFANFQKVFQHDRSQKPPPEPFALPFSSRAVRISGIKLG